MPIDPNIILQGSQGPGLMDTISKAQQMRFQQEQQAGLAEQRQQMAQERAIKLQEMAMSREDHALKQYKAGVHGQAVDYSTDKDGKFHPDVYITAIQGIDPRLAPDAHAFVDSHLKQQAELGKLQSDSSKAQSGAAQSWNKMFEDVARGWQDTPQKLQTYLLSYGKQIGAPDAVIAHYAGGLGTMDLTTFKQAQKGLIGKEMPAADLLGKSVQLNQGNQFQGAKEDVFSGAITPSGAPVPINVTEAQKMQNATTIRGQNLTDARSREMNATQAKLAKSQIEERAKREESTAGLDVTIATGNRLLTHPGMSDAVGFGFGSRKVPGTPAATFQAELDAFKAQNFLPAVQAMRGMGALTEAEGKKLTDAVGALSIDMSEDAFKESLTRILTELEAKKSRKINYDEKLDDLRAPAAPKKTTIVKDQNGKVLPPARAAKVAKLKEMGYSQKEIDDALAGGN